MNFDFDQMRTLLAVLEAGSFEDAAIDLGITASAVSQRIKAMESRAGAILLVRSRPVVPTSCGERILSYVQQISMLGRELSLELQPTSDVTGPVKVSVGVNADSLATWITPIFAQLALRQDMSCEFIRADEHQSTHLLKQGNVSAVVTTRSEALQGCTAQYLGTMRYRAVAAESLLTRVPRAQRDAAWLAALPVVNFDRDDPLQRDLLEQVTGTRRWVDSPVHYVPDSRQFAAAVQAGLGWGMLPELQLKQLGGVQVLDPEWMIQVPLYWQRWSVSSRALDSMGRLLMSAAEAAGLRKTHK